MAISGSQILLLAQTAAGPPGTYTAIGSQSGIKVSKKQQMLDVTDKSMIDKQYIGGPRESSITLDAFYVPNDAALAAINTAYKTGTTVVVQVNELGAALEYANALISQIDKDAKTNTPATLALTLQITGPWEAGAAP